MTKFPALIALSIFFINSLIASTDTTEVNTKKATVTLSNMTDARMDEIFQDAGELSDNSRWGLWELLYKDRIVLIISDQANNRMRIMTAVIEEKEVKKKQLTEILEAQFDRALDVKYALYKEVLWSVYAHPLRELREEQLLNALDQVYNAANNFGTSYVSTNLVFGAGEEE